MDYMLMPYRRYFDFSGRSRRREYWLFNLLLAIVYLVLSLVTGAFSADESGAGLGIGAILLILFVLVNIVPSLAVQVRRFHDQGKSGWMVLLGLIPFLGGIIVLVFMCLEGDRGPNRYGDDPKGVDTTVFD